VCPAFRRREPNGKRRLVILHIGATSVRYSPKDPIDLVPGIGFDFFAISSLRDRACHGVLKT
jgi:hypothetical protein